MTAARVVHVITGLAQGGAEAMLEKLVHAARRHDPGFVQEVVSLQDEGVVGARLRGSGVAVASLGIGRTCGTASGTWTLAGRLREAKSRGPLVVQTWMYHADLVGGLAARLAGVRPVLWNVRQTGLAVGDIGRRTRAVVRACALMSRWIPQRIVCNASAAIEAHAALGYDTSRFVVVPNGFDTDHFRRRADEAMALRRDWGLSDEACVVGMVARLDPQKDHPNFVRMAAVLARSMPQARFILVGRGVPQSAALARLADEAGLGPRLLRLDERHDVAAVMSAFDVFCLSSRAEGFPNVLGEAMACETPCASTDVGDAAHLLGDDAWLAPPGDPQALAERVRRIAGMRPEARRDLGRRQRQRIVSLYAIDSIWQRYRSLYEAALSGR